MLQPKYTITGNFTQILVIVSVILIMTIMQVLLLNPMIGLFTQKQAFMMEHTMHMSYEILQRYPNRSIG